MSRLPWRPQYSDMPTSWFRISFAARGLADELHRRLDSDFTVELPAGSAHVAVGLLLGVPPRERRTLKASLDELISVGFVVACERNGVTVLDCSSLPDVALTRRRQRGSSQHETRHKSDDGTTVGRREHDTDTTLGRQPKQPNSTETFTSASVDNSREEKKELRYMPRLLSMELFGLQIGTVET